MKQIKILLIAATCFICAFSIIYVGQNPDKAAQTIKYIVGVTGLNHITN